jgi:hypothetical protein
MQPPKKSNLDAYVLRGRDPSQFDASFWEGQAAAKNALKPFRDVRYELLRVQVNDNVVWALDQVWVTLPTGKVNYIPEVDDA